MGTLTITATGFSTLGASAPANWPAGVTFPANGSPNGSKSYTISNADWLSLLTWIAAGQQPAIASLLGVTNFGPGSAPMLTPTAAQLLLVWFQAYLVNPSITGVQNFNTTTPATPIPISIS